MKGGVYRMLTMDEGGRKESDSISAAAETGTDVQSL